MADIDPQTRPKCFARLETVFPLAPDGLRQTPPACLECAVKTECLRAALKGGQGLAVHEERLARSYQAGQVGFFERWVRQKGIERQKEKTGRGSRLRRLLKRWG
jgi:hypothetical protein